MYAVVKTGGKQYRVRSGQVIRVEKLDGSVGDTVALDDVLLIGGGESIQVGQWILSCDGQPLQVKRAAKYTEDNVAHCCHLFSFSLCKV